MADFIDCLAMLEFDAIDVSESGGLWMSEIGDSCITIEASEDREFVTVDFNGKETLYVSPDVVTEVLLESYTEGLTG